MKQNLYFRRNRKPDFGDFSVKLALHIQKLAAVKLHHDIKAEKSGLAAFRLRARTSLEWEMFFVLKENDNRAAFMILCVCECEEVRIRRQLINDGKSGVGKRGQSTVKFIHHFRLALSPILSMSHGKFTS